MAAPTLSGLTGKTFNENTVNATPQVIDDTVAFADADNNFNGGTLTVSGLLAEDRISILSGLTISLSGGVVYYDADGAGAGAAVAIGTASGGVGATFTVTFNASATSVMIDALIQNLTYANSSDTPTASRDLLLNITDAAGNDLGASGSPSFTAVTGASNPFDGIDVGTGSAPTFVDLDGDGDLDLVVGESLGTLLTFRNGTVGTAGAFTAVTGASNPFNGIDVGNWSDLTFVDLDGDGDLDLVSGNAGGTLLTFRNGTVGTAGAFTAVTGASNPFDGIDLGDNSNPTFVDLDGDGDADLVVGGYHGRLFYFQNTGTAAAPVFTALTGADNPFNGIDVGQASAPTFADLDGDGDRDMVVGEILGALLTFRNGTVGAAGAFTAVTGASNPFNGIDVGNDSAPTFVDLDGDGDADLVVGGNDGAVRTFLNTTPRGQTITITVTAQNDAPTATSGPDVLTFGVGNDTIDGGDGDDTIDGGEGDDVIVGGSGGDYLRGGLRADAMSGGTGNDTYVVDNAGDTTDETGGDGIDLVHSRISWTLGSGLENLTLGNGGAWSGTGNAVANVIIGNSLANVISGLAGNDTLNGGGGNDTLNGGDDDDTLDGGTQNDMLYGDAGADTLNGGAHNDVLDGGLGADAMTGGTGHDTYVVDDAGDTVIEDAGLGTGTDTVSASISYTLGANVENLTLTGSGDLNGAGNGLANTLTGNSGANTLSGGGGADILNGLAGADTLNGEAGNDTLDGGADNDTLSGGAGQDRLTGGANADTFVFTDLDVRRSGPGFGLASDKDVILDLSFAGGDRIDLSGIDANALLGGDQAFTFVSNFTGVAGQATLKFISGKSVLQLDVDGDRKADLLVEINGNVTGTTGNLYTGGGDVNGGWVL